MRRKNDIGFKQTPLTLAFNRLSFPEALKVFEVASPEERQKLQAMLQRKYQGAIKNEPLSQLRPQYQSGGEQDGPLSLKVWHYFL
ncbi:MAG: hypothetical protein HQK98_02620 [Nitrospirae bacterium]|nr:hypothetical protein [Nitrospirota bacterium]